MMGEEKRWGLMFQLSLWTSGMIALFWCVWHLAVGYVPAITSIKMTPNWIIQLPFAVSRWWDILIGLVWYAALFFFFNKKSYKDEGSDSGFSMFIGLSLSLFLGIFFGFFLGVIGRIFGVVLGLSLGFISGLVFELFSELIDESIFWPVLGVTIGLSFGLIGAPFFIISIVLGVFSRLVLFKNWHEIAERSSFR